MAAVIVFAVAAVLGLALALNHFRDRPRPLPLVLAHGAFGALGLVLLFVVGSSGGIAGNWQLPLAVFVAAALGGFVLFGLDLKQKRMPSAIVVIHALAAVAAFVLLLVAVFG
jgi:hypothetical protein